MGALYEVKFGAQADGTRIVEDVDFIRLRWGRAVDDAGYFELEISGGLFQPWWFAKDNRVEVWRQAAPPAGPWQLLMVGFMRTIKRELQGALETVTISGPDSLYLLGSRIINATRNSTDAKKTGAADDLMKALVRKQMGEDAVTDRDWSDYGFSVEADESAGATVSIRANHENLLDVLREIAEKSRQKQREGDGTAIYFDVVNPTPTTFEFQTFAGLRGVDRSWGSGVNPVILSVENDTLRSATLIRDYTDEITYVYSAGLGQNNVRAVTEVYDDARLGESVFSRREWLEDARSALTEDERTDVGQKALEQRKPVFKFTGEIVDQPGLMFGQDWGLGDRVTAIVSGEQYDVEVWAVLGEVDQDGRETLTGKLRYGDD